MFVLFQRNQFSDVMKIPPLTEDVAEIGMDFGEDGEDSESLDADEVLSVIEDFFTVKQVWLISKKKM